MRKNKKITLLFIFFIVIFGLSLVPDVQAQVNYTLLERVPGFDSTDGSNLPGYIGAIYRVALIVVTLSAVLMLSIGGFMYLTSAGNTSSISTAKGIITDSLIGLVIALTAWLILNVINPDLTNISIGRLAPVAAVPPAGAPPTQGVGAPPTGTAVTLAQQILASGNITLNSSGDCSSPTGVVSPRRNMQETAAGQRMASCQAGAHQCVSFGTAGCNDDMVRPSDSMLQAIVAVGANYRFTITSIAGGPHASGSSHYLGRAIDITPANRSEWQAVLDAFIANGARTPSNSQDRSASMCEDRRGQNVGCAANSGADHVHIVFSN